MVQPCEFIRLPACTHSILYRTFSQSVFLLVILSKFAYTPNDPVWSSILRETEKSMLFQRMGLLSPPTEKNTLVPFFALHIARFPLRQLNYSIDDRAWVVAVRVANQTF